MQSEILDTYKIPIKEVESARWKLAKPLEATVEKRENGFIACFYDIQIYGYGNSISESVDDLKYALISQYEFLLKAKEKVKLGILPEKQLKTLEELFFKK